MRLLVGGDSAKEHLGGRVRRGVLTYVHPMTHAVESQPKAPMSDWWACLEEQTHREIQANVLRDRRMTAVEAICEACAQSGWACASRSRWSTPLRGPRRPSATQAARSPRHPSLAARVTALPGRVTAVEALWDGDTVNN